MSLPFKRRVVPIRLEIAGIDGPVFVRPYSLREFEAVEPKLEALKENERWLDLVKEEVSRLIVNEDGSALPVSPSDWDDYDAPVLADLWYKVCSRCGFARREVLEKN
jgi:hypothetical protein